MPGRPQCAVLAPVPPGRGWTTVRESSPDQPVTPDRPKMVPPLAGVIASPFPLSVSVLNTVNGYGSAAWVSQKFQPNVMFCGRKVADCSPLPL